MSKKILDWLEQNQPETPCVVVDVSSIDTSYRRLKYFLPWADVYYAVKANPGEPVIKELCTLKSNFDCASIQEIQLCLSQGAQAKHISYGNTVKKETDIKKAYDLGVRLFCFDSLEELEKLSRVAPEANVFCRILTPGEGADWPLSRKFGCDTEMAIELLVKAKELGLQPYGVSFHVGSQQRDVTQWRAAISETAGIFEALKREDIQLKMINLGGGFPATYIDPAEGLEWYATGIEEYLNENFGDDWPRIIIEPGRSMVADSGIVQTEVVAVTRKTKSEFEPRWVFLDIGKFTGLVESFEEAIKYRIQTPYDATTTGTSPVILAGPTCDSLDVIFEKYQYQMPEELKAGDKILLLSAGAYTTSYSSVNFNGFPPLKAHYI